MPKTAGTPPLTLASRAWKAPPSGPPPVFGRVDLRKKARSRASQRLLRMANIVVAVDRVVVLVGSVIAYVEYRNHQIHPHRV